MISLRHLTKSGWITNDDLVQGVTKHCRINTQSRCYNSLFHLCLPKSSWSPGGKLWLSRNGYNHLKHEPFTFRGKKWAIRATRGVFLQLRKKTPRAGGWWLNKLIWKEKKTYHSYIRHTHIRTPRKNKELARTRQKRPANEIWYCRRSIQVLDVVAVMAHALLKGS